MFIRFLRPLALTMLIVFAASTTKADYTSLTVKEHSGTWTSFGVAGLKVTFGLNSLTIENKEQKQVFPIKDVYSLLPTDLPTSINRAQQTRTIVSIEGRQVRLNVKAGTLARVYDSLGRLYTTARVGQEGVPVVVGNLQPGIYLIKAGDEKCKILVK